VRSKTGKRKPRLGAGLSRWACKAWEPTYASPCGKRFNENFGDRIRNFTGPQANRHLCLFRSKLFAFHHVRNVSIRPAKSRAFRCQFFPHSSAAHAHRIAPNQDNLELSVMRERGLHVGIMDWLQIWVVANALLLACWVLGVAGEMKTRDRINYRTWVISGMPEVEPFLRGDPGI
jgi:hypothetical protein